MINREALTRHIKWAEAAAGPERFPYRDTVKKKLTIGYGRNLDDVGISPDEAEYLLRNDINAAIADACTLPYWESLNTARRMVLVDMVFNLGLPKFLRFVKLGAALHIGDYRLAAAEMIDSRWYRQTRRRAKILVDSMRTGEWQGG